MPEKEKPPAMRVDDFCQEGKMDTQTIFIDIETISEEELLEENEETEDGTDK